MLENLSYAIANIKVIEVLDGLQLAGPLGQFETVPASGSVFHLSDFGPRQPQHHVLQLQANHANLCLGNQGLQLVEVPASRSKVRQETRNQVNKTPVCAIL